MTAALARALRAFLHAVALAGPALCGPAAFTVDVDTYARCRAGLPPRETRR